MIRVYIASPYSGGDVAENVATAMFYANELMSLGVAPYCPHLSHFAHMAHHRPYEDWLALDLEWLACCHAVLRLDGHSPGADREVIRAGELGLPVFRELGELADWSKTR